MPSERTRRIRRILLGVLAANLAVAVAKLAVGFFSGAISMVADGFHSLTDSASNVVGLVGISVAARPPDKDHPYGHRKFETLAALAIGGLLALAAWEVLESCIHRLIEGGEPQATPLGFAVMAGSIVVSLVISRYEHRRGHELASQVLTADAAHTRSDVYASLAVVASLVATRLGYPWLDPLAALAITLLIARAAYQILRDSAASLTDTAVVDVDLVRRAALAVAGVESVHKIRSRGVPDSGHLDLHIQVRPDLRLDQAHVIGHMVAERLRRELGFGDVVAHVEPPEGHRTEWRPDEARADRRKVSPRDS